MALSIVMYAQLNPWDVDVRMPVPFPDRAAPFLDIGDENSCCYLLGISNWFCKHLEDVPEVGLVLEPAIDWREVKIFSHPRCKPVYPSRKHKINDGLLLFQKFNLLFYNQPGFERVHSQKMMIIERKPC